jgi:hypothetical protein
MRRVASSRHFGKGLSCISLPELEFQGDFQSALHAR